jgi:hypothetical protein
MLTGKGTFRIRFEKPARIVHKFSSAPLDTDSLRRQPLKIEFERNFQLSIRARNSLPVNRAIDNYIRLFGRGVCCTAHKVLFKNPSTMRKPAQATGIASPIGE